jgi:hypothetical protein
MDNQEKRIAKREKRDKEIVYMTDGTRHHVSAKGDTADGLAAAGAAILGFVVGVFLTRR